MSAIATPKGRDSNYRNSRNNPRHALVKVFHVYARKVPAYISASTSRNRGPPLYYYGRNITERDTLARFLRATLLCICNATAAATYAVTPINIDQAQQWPAGKRIDILYFPPMLTGLPPRDVLLKLRYRDKLQDMLSSPRFYARRDANGRERYGG